MDPALQSCPVEVTLSHDMAIQEDFVMKIGPVEFSVTQALNFLRRIPELIPMSSRDQYRSHLVHLSLTAIGRDMQILVYRQSLSQPWWKYGGRSSQDGQQANPNLFAWTVPVSNLSDFSIALRDAVFMVLGCHGGILKGGKWLSARCFLEGREILDRFRQTWDLQDMVKAKYKFAEAVHTDSTHYPAWYYYGTLLLAERTRASIQQAERAFEQTLYSQNPRLRALAHAGIANCFVQQVHRLAIHRPDVLESAKSHARQADEAWKESGETMPHAWILATSALVLHVDEDGAIEDRTWRYLEAAKIYDRACELDPHNTMLYNNAGWVFLKLAEWGIGAVTENELGLTVGIEDTAREAQRLFQKALELYPKNKLTHANLCLLYALPSFREESNREACRFHGMAAVKIDPQYIGGHRDLAVSLIRYGELDEAFHYFQMALRLCGDIYKGKEMTEETLVALREMNIYDEREAARWRNAVFTLVVPKV